MTDKADPLSPYSEADNNTQDGGNFSSPQGCPPPRSEAYPPIEYTSKPEPYPSQPVYSQPQPLYGQPQYDKPQYTQDDTSQTAMIERQHGGPDNVFMRPRPPDYMIAAIFACICGFCPTGLCAIYFASQASKLASVGDMVGARRMSNNAKNLIISSILIGIILIVMVLVLEVVAFFSIYSRIPMQT